MGEKPHVPTAISEKRKEKGFVGGLGCFSLFFFSLSLKAVIGSWTKLVVFSCAMSSGNETTFRRVENRR